MSFLSQVGDVAREAGELIRELSTNRALRIEEKGSSYDFVTEADTGSQRLIARRVGEMFPGDIVIGTDGRSVRETAKEMRRLIDAPDRAIRFGQGEENET